MAIASGCLAAGLLCVVLEPVLLPAMEPSSCSFAEQLNVPEPDSPEALATKPRCRIRLFIGPAKPHKPFWVTAYIQNGDGQNCTLKLPAGVTLVKDERPSNAVETPAKKSYAVVTWRVIVEKEGEYALEAILDEGVKDKAIANVLVGGIFR
jgi:hypothetical protein